MSEPRRTAHATVTLTIEVDTGTWGPECTIGQATKQAEEEARHRITRLLEQAVTSDANLKIKRETLRGIRIGRVTSVATRLVEES